MVRFLEVTRARDRFRLFARACSPNGGPGSSTLPGMKVLDLAAAPGGKSTQLAAYLANQGVLAPTKFQASELRF